RVVAALEGIGAAVESDHPGIAWFEEKGLRGVHGGTVESVITTARRALAVATRGTPSPFASPSGPTGSSSGGVSSSPGALSARGSASGASRAGEVVAFSGPVDIAAPGGGGPSSRGLGSPGGGTGMAGVGRIGAAQNAAASSGAGRVGAAPSRFAALAAAHRARARRPEIAPDSPARL